MFKKTLSVCILIMCGIMITPINAASIGITAGYGYYWEESYGERNSYSGFTLGGDLEFPVGNFAIAPTLNFWMGSESEYGNQIIGLISTWALKYYPLSPKARVAPYIGVEPALHIMSGGWMPVLYFGFNGLIGISINLSDYLQIPIQLSCGLLFAERGTKINTGTVKLGLAIGI